MARCTMLHDSPRKGDWRQPAAGTGQWPQGQQQHGTRHAKLGSSVHKAALQMLDKNYVVRGDLSQEGYAFEGKLKPTNNREKISHTSIRIHLYFFT